MFDTFVVSCLFYLHNFYFILLFRAALFSLLLELGKVCCFILIQTFWKEGTQSVIAKKGILWYKGPKPFCCLLLCLCACLPVFLLACLPTFLPSWRLPAPLPILFMPACLPLYLPLCLLAWLPSLPFCLLWIRHTCLSACLPVYLPPSLPTYFPCPLSVSLLFVCLPSLYSSAPLCQSIHSVHLSVFFGILGY